MSPVSLEFEGVGAARSIEISNPGDQPTDIQVRLFAWTTDGGQDRHVPSSDIGFSPPIFHLAPGGRQIVRFVPLRPAGDREQAYRLYVDQLPGALEPEGLQMPVRMVLPLFVEPAGVRRREGSTLAQAKALRWRAVLDPAGRRVRLIAANDGRRRVRLVDLAYVQDGAERSIRSGLAGYVLAGQERAWEFDYSGPVGDLTVKATADGGVLTARAPFLSD